MPNEYTRSWQRTFLQPTSPTGPRTDKTGLQLQFLVEQLPLPDFRRVLDVCCGLGRHAMPLSQLGYQVVGVDRDEGMIAEGMARDSAVEFLRLDMRQLYALSQDFDGVVCMWQSFGYFDARENESVLSLMAERLRLGGRLILDLYNRDKFEAAGFNGSGGGRHSHHGGLDWTEHARYDKDTGRLTVQLEWSSGEGDEFDWQLYSPDDMKELGERCGLKRGVDLRLLRVQSSGG